MAEGWLKRTYAEIGELYDSTVPIVAEWHDGQGGEVTLYADGLIEADGPFPVELLAYMLVDWHAYLRAPGPAVPAGPTGVQAVG